METSTITAHAIVSIVPLLPRQHLATVLLIRETRVAMACCMPLAIRWITRGTHPHHSRSLESSCQSLLTMSFRIPFSTLQTYIHHHKQNKNIQISGHYLNSYDVAQNWHIAACLDWAYFRTIFFYILSVLVPSEKNKKYKLQVTNSIPICVNSLKLILCSGALMNKQYTIG